MFEITGTGNIRQRRRRPANWDALECWHDYHFVPENRRLDADERELIVRAIGLYDIHPDAAYTFDDRRLKRLARGFCRTRCLDLVADPS